MAVEPPSQKDLIELGADDNTTNVRFRTFYRRAKSGGIRVPTTFADILGVRLKLKNLLGGSLAIPEVDPPLALADPREQAPQLKAKATSPTGDTSEAVTGPLPLQLASGKVGQGLEDQVAVEPPPRRRT